MFRFFKKEFVKIPCKHSQPGSAICNGGKLLIYGEMGYRPPEWITCPKCNGSGTVVFTVKELNEAVDLIDEEIAILKEERRELIRLFR
jgi:hypothetical protein